ncbi:MAG: hypothetical protein J6Y94_02685 [Bacteriovoracaceae bacterium]|nr:hypothetical protein [Bacteriovoracaceae bacterium]
MRVWQMAWPLVAILSLTAALPAQAGSHFGLMTCLHWFLPKEKKPARVGVTSAEREKFTAKLRHDIEEIFALNLDPAKQRAAFTELQQKTLAHHPHEFWPQYRQFAKENYLKILQGELPPSYLRFQEANWQHQGIQREDPTAWQLADLEGFLGLYASLVRHPQARQLREAYLAQKTEEKFLAVELYPWVKPAAASKIAERLAKFIATYQTAAVEQQLPADWLLDNLPRLLKLIYLQNLPSLAEALPTGHNEQSLVRRWLRQDLSLAFQGVADSEKAYYRTLLTKIYRNNFSAALLEFLGQEFARFNFISVQQKPMDFWAQQKRVAILGRIVFDPVYASVISPAVGESFYGMALHTAALWALYDGDSTVPPAVVEEEKVNALIHSAIKFRDEYIKNPHLYRPFDAVEASHWRQLWMHLSNFLPPPVFTQHHWDTAYAFWVQLKMAPKKELQ